MLCAVCQGTIQKVWELAAGKLAHHSSSAGLVQSVKEGCFICCDLEGYIVERKTGSSQFCPDQSIFWRFIDLRSRDFLLFQVYFKAVDIASSRGHSLGSFDFLCSYSLKPVPNSSNPICSSGQRNGGLSTAFSDNTGSYQTISQIKDWLEACITTHDRCNLDCDSAWMPTRLLELCGSDKDPKIRLRNRSELASNRYLTLSHCWGPMGSQKLQLTAESFEALRRGIAVSDLQQTFQDMADITARLGFRYFWVDCMCIFQDDPGDWREQSSLMGKIYANTWLNVSATWAAESSEGCFRYRDISRKLHYIDKPAHGATETTTWALTQADVWGKEVEHAPVNLRGWVLQERVLSSRVVHFSKTQVFWECRKLRASETFPNGGLPDEGPISDSMVKQLPPTITSPVDDKSDNYWTHLARKYSSCDLTFDTDRLIALSGLAHEVHKRRPSGYLAGLWSRDLPYNLTWHNTRLRVRPTNYTAPTWSWTSMRGDGSGIEFRHATREAMQNMQMLGYSTTLKNPKHPFGEVTDGFIKVRACLAIISFERCSGFEYDLSLTNAPEETWRSLTIPRSTATICQGRVYLDTVKDEELSTAYFVHVYTDIYMGPDVQPKRMQEMHGLLLMPLPSSQFKRVGYASIFILDQEDSLHNMSQRDIIII